MNEIILDTVKENVGGGVVHEHFNNQLISDINAVIMELRQIGVGPQDPFIVVDGTETWASYLEDDVVLLSVVPTLVSLKVRMLFDPPSGSLADEINRQIDRLEWRVNSYYETGI